MTKNKDQHYIPAFYLYHFTNEEQKRDSSKKSPRNTSIFHYDFQKKCVKARPIEKIATESYLLSHKRADGSYDHSLDNELQAVENKAADAIRKLNEILESIIRNKSLFVPLDNSIMNDLIDLIVWQIRRHPEVVNKFEQDCEQYLAEQKRPIDEAKCMALKVVKEVGGTGDYDIKAELMKKNKTIVYTTNKDSHFITTDKPFVRFNKTKPNGIAVQDTELYFPITSNMLLFMCNNGDRREFHLENDDSFLKDLNKYIGSCASRYLFGPNKSFLEQLAIEIENKKNT